METVKIREVQVKYTTPKTMPKSVRNSDDVVGFIRKIIKGESREMFISVYLDAAYQPIGYAINHIGNANSCTMDPKIILQPALLLGSVAIVVAHNHPSGEITPSNEDIAVTERLLEACKVFGIKLLDHVIVTDWAHKSLKAEALVKGL